MNVSLDQLRPPDGTTPAGILEGGFLPQLNKKPYPQNFNLVGVTVDNSETELLEFETKQDLSDYADTLSPHPPPNFLAEPGVPSTYIETQVNAIWAKKIE